MQFTFKVSVNVELLDESDDLASDPDRSGRIEASVCEAIMNALNAAEDQGFSHQLENELSATVGLVEVLPD